MIWIGRIEGGEMDQIAFMESLMQQKLSFL